jgi:hypothetical protein
MNKDLKQISLTILLVFSIAFINHIQAQEEQAEKRIEKYKISTWFGTRNISSEIFELNQNLDFINYLNSNDEYAEDDYLGFAAHFWLKGNWEAELEFALNSSFRPSSFKVRSVYFPIKHLGLSIGAFAYPQLIDEFNNFHLLTDLGYFGDINSNFRQREVHDLGISAGIVLPINYHFLHFELQLNGGFSSYNKFKEIIKQKQINSNLIKEIEYTTKISPAFFISPELEIYADIVKIKNTVLGVQVQASAFKSKKNIDYQRTVYIWTANNPVIEQINSPNHTVEKFELDFGLYLSF